MDAVDTNVIVRLLTQDDELQYQKSLEIFQMKNIFIPDTVILETEWVLRFAYKFKREALTNDTSGARKSLPRDRFVVGRINPALEPVTRPNLRGLTQLRS